MEKLQIKQTSLLKNQNVNIDEFNVNPGHQCTSCDYKLYEEGSEIFDDLKNLEPSLSNEIKMALVYCGDKGKNYIISLNFWERIVPLLFS